MSYRIENLIASTLLKWVYFQQDTLGEGLDLRYFRDVDGREVDFVIVSGKKPISPALKYLKIRFPDCEAWQISAIGKKNYVGENGIRVCPAVELLSTLV